MSAADSMVCEPAAAAAVNAMMAALSAAWAAHDAKAYAAHFTPSAVFVPFNGDVCVGRDVIEQIHHDTFQGMHRSSSLENVAVESAESLSAGAIFAQVSRDVVRSTADGGGDLSRNKYRIVLLLVQPDGASGPWLISRWHATRVGGTAKSAESVIRQLVAEAAGADVRRTRVSVLVSLAAFAALAVGAAAGVRPRVPRTALVSLAVAGMAVVAALK